MTSSRKAITVLLAIPLLVLIMVASWPLVSKLITMAIIDEEILPSTEHLVIENWSGEVELYDEAAKIISKAGEVEVLSIIFDEYYRNERKRHFFMLSAWASGLDTTKLRLLPVPHREPKTMNIARAVIDSARAWGWREFTLATVQLHTARSRKAYIRFAAEHGITVHVVGLPYDKVRADNWTKSATGLSLGFSEFIKRVYYEVFVF